jgi:hypothetical protein
MIAFDCDRCGKPLIVPNAKAGEQTSCPGCGRGLLIPTALQRPAAPKLLWLLPVAAIIIVAVAVSMKWRSAAKDPALIRERLTAKLSLTCPQCRGSLWQSCDPVKGEYKVTVFYAGPRETHVFEVTLLAEADRTFIAVDPAPPPARWLALASFFQGQLDSFDYNGADLSEKEDLERVAEALDDALREAAR